MQKGLLILLGVIMSGVAAEKSYPACKVRAQPRVPGCNSAGAAERSYRTSEARVGGREELPHVQGAVATWAQEVLEELFHVQGQEGRQ